MWRTILLIQRYSTVARTVGIPNPNRPLLSGAGYKRNCACWQIVSVYCCLRHTAPAAQRKISTVSIRVLQSPHDDVLRKIWRHIVVCLACAKGLCVINPRVANSIPFFTGIGEPHRGFITFYSFCAQFDRNIGKFCLC